MQALLKLVQAKDDAKRLLDHCTSHGIKLVNREHGVELTAEIVENGGFSLNHGGYGSKITLGTGKGFSSKWKMVTNDELLDSKKPFTNLTIFIHESVAPLKQIAMRAFIAKNGGVIGSDCEGELWIHTLKHKEVLASIPEKVVRVDLNAFLIAFPSAAKALEKSIDPEPTAKGGKNRKAKITPLQIAEFEEIKLLLSDDDLANVNVGLLRARELSEHLDHLLGDLKIKDGELSNAGLYRQLGRSTHRDFIVYNLLSMAADDSKAAWTRAAITSICLKHSSATPVLIGFDGLERLAITANTNGNLVDDSLRLETGFDNCSAFPFLVSLRTSIPLKGLSAPLLDDLCLQTDCFVEPENSAIPARVRSLSLHDIPSLHDLGFLNGNKTIQRIHVANCPSLRDISALESLPALTHALIEAEIETPPSAWPEKFIHLEAEKWTSESLGKLPPGLMHLTLGACTGIKNLKCLEHCKAPFTDHSLGSNLTNREKIVNTRTDKDGSYIYLSYESGDSCWGVAPAGHLNLSGCQGIASIDGLFKGCGLKQIGLPSHAIDVSALAEMPDVSVVVGSVSEDVIQALSCLPKLRLKIADCYSLKDLKDLAFLEPIASNLVALDLTQVYMVRDVSSVVKMENLEELKIDGRSENPAMAQLKKSRLTSRGQIDAFRLKFMAGG